MPPKKSISGTKTGRSRSPSASPDERGKTAKQEGRFIFKSESAEDDVVMQELAEQTDCVRQLLPQDGDVIYINWEGEGEYLCKLVADEDGQLGAEPLDGSWSDPDLEFDPHLDDWHWPSVEEEDDGTSRDSKSSTPGNSNASYLGLFSAAMACLLALLVYNHLFAPIAGNSRTS